MRWNGVLDAVLVALAGCVNMKRQKVSFDTTLEEQWPLCKQLFSKDEDAGACWWFGGERGEMGKNCERIGCQRKVDGRECARVSFILFCCLKNEVSHSQMTEQICEKK